MRLLFAEDDHELRETVARGLREQRWAVDTAATGDEALTLALVHAYDAIVLDVAMPGHDGIAVCRTLRARGSTAPILMLTARESVEDRIIGLDAGADDYLTKPFHFGELTARVRALLRRPGAVVTNVLQVGDLQIDTSRQIATRGARTLTLTAREYACLTYLARHAGRVVSRGELASHVWDDNRDPNANLIDVYVSRLRRKVDGDASVPLLHTRRGLGVVLEAPAAAADVDA